MLILANLILRLSVSFYDTHSKNAPSHSDSLRLFASITWTSPSAHITWLFSSPNHELQIPLLSDNLIGQTLKEYCTLIGQTRRYLAISWEVASNEATIMIMQIILIEEVNLGSSGSFIQQHWSSLHLLWPLILSRLTYSTNFQMFKNQCRPLIMDLCRS